MNLKRYTRGQHSGEKHPESCIVDILEHGFLTLSQAR